MASRLGLTMLSRRKNYTHLVDTAEHKFAESCRAFRCLTVKHSTRAGRQVGQASAVPFFRASQVLTYRGQTEGITDLTSELAEP